MAQVYKNPLDQAEAISNENKDPLKFKGTEPAWSGDSVTRDALRLKQDGWLPEKEKWSDAYYHEVKDALGKLPKNNSGFTPTKETIWNDPKHPLYGIGPEEQNIEYLQSAIDEIGRKTQSPAHWRFYGGPQGGGTRLDAIKKANQYKKALAYIKSFGGK